MPKRPTIELLRNGRGRSAEHAYSERMHGPMAIVFWICWIVPAQTAGPSDAPRSIEDEVAGNIRQQPVGSHTVGDDRLPPPFVSRIADRIIRQSFEERYRVVITDADADRLSGTATSASTAARPATLATTRPAAVTQESVSRRGAEAQRRNGLRWLWTGSAGVLIVIIAQSLRRHWQRRRGR